MEQDLADLETMYGNLPVWTTEYGFNNALGKPNSWPVPENVAARYLPIFALELFLRHPQSKNYIYELIDQGKDPGVAQMNWGLLRSDMTKKPAFYAIKTLMALTSDDAPASGAVVPLDVSIEGDTGDLRQVVLRKADGRAVLLLWRNRPLWDPQAFTTLAPSAGAVTITLAQPATFAILDLSRDRGTPASTTAPATAGRTLTLDVPAHVMAVQITPAS
jgi:hypothetical protein